MNVVIAGAGGLIGTALRRSLEGDGHAVTRVVRRAPQAPGEIGWPPFRLRGPRDWTTQEP
jgi:uncharacterized protein